MTPPGHHPLLDQTVVTVKEDKKDISGDRRQEMLVESSGAMQQDLSVETLQGRACHKSTGA